MSDVPLPPAPLAPKLAGNADPWNTADGTAYQPIEVAMFNQLARPPSQTHRSTSSSRIMLLAVLLVLAAPITAQNIQLQAPEQTIIGAPLEIGFEGSSSRKDFITIVTPRTAEGAYSTYKYARSSPVVIDAPVTPGDYEIRYLGGQRPYPTLDRRALRVEDVSASLKAPSTVKAGAGFKVTWKGPGNPRDFVSIVAAGTGEGKYTQGYQYTKRGAALSFKAPDEPGDYEIRYLMGNAPYRTLGRTALKVTSTQATLSSQPEIMAGASLSINWQGPNNSGDNITIVNEGAKEKTWGDYVYTAKGSPVRLMAPESPGRYELRYVTGQSHTTLARSALTVVPASASLSGPHQAPAKSVISVSWQGPGNLQDYLIIVPAGSEKNANGPYAYVKRGPELRIATPVTPGDYEIRYVTGRDQNILANQALNITPRPIPGRLRVLDDSRAEAPGNDSVIAVILDASGSMLRKIDGERRIDIAKTAVKRLIAKVLPESASFTLRVFGHKQAGSCRTDVEIPIGPLKRSAAANRISAISAMNLAKTPIARSLALVGEDLAGRAGRHTIILVTDGEETCGGDPAKVIETLIADGLDVRVNIVGFAIDERMLQESFQRWARLGKGAYFDAQNAQELELGLEQAVEIPWELVSADDEVVATGVVNGAAVAVSAGRYQLRVLIRPVLMQREVTIKADTEAFIALE